MSYEMNYIRLKELISSNDLEIRFPEDLGALYENNISLYFFHEAYIDIGKMENVAKEIPVSLIHEGVGWSDGRSKCFQSSEVLKEMGVEFSKLIGIEFEYLYIREEAKKRLLDNFKRDKRESAANQVENMKNLCKMLSIALQLLEEEISPTSSLLDEKGNLEATKLVNLIYERAENWKGTLNVTSAYKIHGKVQSRAHQTVEKAIRWARNYKE